MKGIKKIDKKSVCVLALLAAGFGTEVNAENYQFIYLVKGVGISQAELDAPWIQFATDNGLSYPNDWSSLSWGSENLDSIPSDQYPNSTPSGNIRLNYNPSLTSIEGLSGITSIGGYLMLGNNNFQDLTPLSDLVSAGGVDLHNNNLNSLLGLNNLRTVNGSLRLWDNNLTNLNSLSSLETVGNHFDLYYNDLTDITGLSSLVSVGSRLNFIDAYGTGAPYLTDLRGLENLASVGSAIVLPDREYSPKLSATSDFCTSVYSGSIILTYDRFNISDPAYNVSYDKVCELP